MFVFICIVVYPCKVHWTIGILGTLNKYYYYYFYYYLELDKMNNTLQETLIIFS